MTDDYNLPEIYLSIRSHCPDIWLLFTLISTSYLPTYLLFTTFTEFSITSSDDDNDAWLQVQRISICFCICIFNFYLYFKLFLYLPSQEFAAASASPLLKNQRCKFTARPALNQKSTFLHYSLHIVFYVLVYLYIDLYLYLYLYLNLYLYLPSIKKHPSPRCSLNCIILHCVLLCSC